MNNYKKAVDKIKFSSDFEKKLIEKLSEENNSKQKTVFIGDYKKRKNRKRLILSVAAVAAACAVLIISIAQVLDINGILTDNINVLKGTVQSAVDAKSVENTQIILTRKPLAGNNENIEPSVFTARTDKDGSFTVEAPTGEYTATVVKDGYIESTVEITLPENGEKQTENTFFISPVMEESTYRAVLTWENDIDLDGCLTLPDENGGRYSLFYSQSDYVTASGDKIASLDIDNMHGDGPETITFCPVGDGEYRFSVACYSALVNGSGSVLYDSKPTVTLYKGGSVIGKYSLTDKSSGNVWNVFEISGGSVKEINRVDTVKSVDEIK